MVLIINLDRLSASNGKDKYIDLLRGVAMFLVMWHHASLAGAIYILGFHMPFFFFLTGYLYRLTGSLDKTWEGYWKSRFQRMIIPYFEFGLLSIVLSMIVFKDFSVSKKIVKLLLCIKTKNVDTIPYIFWFLMCMFWACIYCYLAKRIADAIKLNVAIFVLICFAVNGLLYYIDWKLPLSMDNAFLGAAFILLGNIMKKYLDALLNSKFIFQLIAFFVGCVGLALMVRINYGAYYMYINTYGNYFIAQVGAFFGSLSFFIVMKWVISIFSAYPKMFSILERYFLWISDRTIVIFPIHLILYYFLLDKMNNYLCLLITIIIIVPIVNFIYKYLSFMTGERVRIENKRG